MISVIVPIYNVEKYLEKCVNSILNQSYSDLEIILVDDGSPDRCPEICDQYADKDKRIRVIHKKNGGLSDARNAGLDIAKGEYISFIDSDDYIDPLMFEKMMDSIMETEADICICGYQEVDEEGTVLKSITQPSQVITQKEAFSYLMDGNVFYAIMCNKVFKRDIFENRNLRFPVGKIHEDEFIIHYLYGECCGISVLNNVFYHYFTRSESIMHLQRLSSREFDDVEVYLDRAKYFHSINLENYAAQLLCYIPNDSVRVFHLARHDADTKDRVRRIKSDFKRVKSSIDSSSLKWIRRFGINIFAFSFHLYRIWNCVISAGEKIKAKIS